MPDVFISSTPKKEVVGKPDSSGRLPKVDISKISEEDFRDITIPEGSDVHTMPGHTHNLLSAYCFYPDHVKFVNADRDEKMILLLREHPITNLPWIIVAFAMLISPPFFSLFSFFEGLPGDLKLLITLTWYLIVAAFVLEEFLSWFFNVNLITDERIFDVDFLNLMYREISEADLDQIQDVTVEMGGAARTFFGYGNVYIQTAAQLPRIEFKSVPHPDKVAKILRELGIQEEVERLEGRIR